MLLRLCSGVALLGCAAAHGMMTFPKPRNACVPTSAPAPSRSRSGCLACSDTLLRRVDGAVAPFNNWSWHPNDLSCNASDKSGDHCKYYGFNNGIGACPHAAKNGVPGALNGSNGQACYWFS